jgi:type II secretory ATPase GspE/PulE/Tfp pilus assembly ATPase PilB-like protein
VGISGGPGGRGGFASVDQSAKEATTMSNPIGHIARHLVTNAIDAQATEVQIKLEGNKMVVCYDDVGDVQHQMEMAGHIFPPVTTRYKLWADVDLLNRRYPLKGQFALIHRRRHYSVDAVWENPRQDPRVTLRIVAGAEAQVDEDGPEELFN